MFCPICGDPLRIFLEWVPEYPMEFAKKCGCHSHTAIAGCKSCNKVYGLKGAPKNGEKEIELVLLEVKPEYSYEKVTKLIPAGAEVG